MNKALDKKHEPVLNKKTGYRTLVTYYYESDAIWLDWSRSPLLVMIEQL
jgi:hypothetical protein